MTFENYSTVDVSDNFEKTKKSKNLRVSKLIEEVKLLLLKKGIFNSILVLSKDKLSLPKVDVKSKTLINEVNLENINSSYNLSKNKDIQLYCKKFTNTKSDMKNIEKIVASIKNYLEETYTHVDVISVKLIPIEGNKINILIILYVIELKSISQLNVVSNLKDINVHLRRYVDKNIKKKVSKRNLERVIKIIENKYNCLPSTASLTLNYLKEKEILDVFFNSRRYFFNVILDNKLILFLFDQNKKLFYDHVNTFNLKLNLGFFYSIFETNLGVNFRYVLGDSETKLTFNLDKLNVKLNYLNHDVSFAIKSNVGIKDIHVKDKKLLFQENYLVDFNENLSENDERCHSKQLIEPIIGYKYSNLFFRKYFFNIEINVNLIRLLVDFVISIKTDDLKFKLRVNDILDNTFILFNKFIGITSNSKISISKKIGKNKIKIFLNLISLNKNTIKNASINILSNIKFFIMNLIPDVFTNALYYGYAVIGLSYKYKDKHKVKLSISNLKRLKIFNLDLSTKINLKCFYLRVYICFNLVTGILKNIFNVFGNINPIGKVCYFKVKVIK